MGFIFGIRPAGTDAGGLRPHEAWSLAASSQDAGNSGRTRVQVDTHLVEVSRELDIVREELGNLSFTGRRRAPRASS